MEWQKLEHINQLQTIIEESFTHAVAIFKHSSRCSISISAKDRMERQWSFPVSVISVYYLDLLEHRDISNKIAAISQVQHESPQLLIFRNGKVVYHTSHSGIIPRLLTEADFA